MTIIRKISLAAFLLAIGLSSSVSHAFQGAEGGLDRFMGKPELTLQQLFQGERFPNVAIAKDGTVLATWGTSRVRVKRSEDGGKTFGNEIEIALFLRERLTNLIG